MKKISLKSTERWDIFKELIDYNKWIYNRNGPIKVLDVATGHGKYAEYMVEQGFDVTAFDARDERFPVDGKAKYLVSNVDDFDYSGYDLILCLGILYHLPYDRQVEMLKKCSYAITIVDTHLCDPLEIEIVNPDTGEEGKLYKEGPVTNPRNAIDTDMAFWHTRQSLHKLFLDCGYHFVSEIHPYHEKDRTFFICHKSWI